MNDGIIIKRDGHLGIGQLGAITENPELKVHLDRSEAYQKAIENNHNFLKRHINEGHAVYGATTGFGSSSKNRTSISDIHNLQVNLFRYHNCGVGEYLTESQSLATMVSRLQCLAQGYSGVSYELLLHLEEMINRRILPQIPAIGSVGASGDLTPLAYLASAMVGEGAVIYRGESVHATEAFRMEGMVPYKFKVREALAIMNGTSVLTAIASLACHQIYKFYQYGTMASGMFVTLMQGHTTAYSELIHQRKKHMGQRQAAADILKWINLEQKTVLQNDEVPVQDPYSLRCSPHIYGAFFDCLQHSQKMIEDELNSVSDNPVIDSENKCVMNGGNFFGNYVAHACDNLKSTLGTVVNLWDQQAALLMNTKLNGLSENLICRNKLGVHKSSFHHGFKALQITLSALAAEIIKHSSPFAVCSRPTESLNQDVVSMGTTAARELARMESYSKDALSVLMLFVSQGFAVYADQGIRIQLNEACSTELEKFKDVFTPMIEDRALDVDIQKMKHFLFKENS